MGAIPQVMSGAMPIALPSQVDLSALLNTRRAVDMGLVLCCDTFKGVTATKALISNWGDSVVREDFMIGFIPRGGVLLISISNSPFGEGGQYLDALETELSAFCRSAQGNYLGGCVISRAADIRNAMNMKNKYYREKFLSFVYIDLFTSSKAYTVSLGYWYGMLAVGGVMIGKLYFTLLWCILLLYHHCCLNNHITSVLRF
jgi:hypothetical protein